MKEINVYQLETKWNCVKKTYGEYDIRNGNDVKKYLNGVFDSKPEQEHIVVLHIDASGNLKGREIVAIGNMVSVGAGVREIYRSAINIGSYAIVLVHNHPTSDLRPSDPDIEFTKAVVMAGKIIGIPVLEHYICDSMLEKQPTKLTNSHGALWGLTPYFVDDKTILDENGLMDLDQLYNFKTIKSTSLCENVDLENINIELKEDLI